MRRPAVGEYCTPPPPPPPPRGAVKEFSLINQQHDCAVPHLSLLGAITSRHRIGNIPGSARLGSARRGAPLRGCSSSLAQVIRFLRGEPWGIFRKRNLRQRFADNSRDKRERERDVSSSRSDPVKLFSSSVLPVALVGCVRTIFRCRKINGFIFDIWTLGSDEQMLHRGIRLISSGSFHYCE